MSEPKRIAQTWFWAILGVFALGMLCIFHFIWTDNSRWALVWWYLTFFSVPTLISIAFKSIRKVYLGEQSNPEHDILGSYSVALGAALLFGVGTAIFYSQFFNH